MYAKSSNDLENESGILKPGHCGISIAWKKHLGQCAKKINIDSDRIIAVQLNNIGNNNSNIYVIGVYLPQRQCMISDFNANVALLETLIEQYKQNGEVVVIGDFNAHFGWEYGNRFWGDLVC